MDALDQQYRGFSISVTPLRDHDDLWDFVYHITRSGEPVVLLGGIARSQTLGGHATPEIACLAGLEVAKTEVDNLLALEEK